MTLHLRVEDARRFLSEYHFAATDVAGVMERLGTVQYDPLNPVGRNVDLVFQARVPDYRVDEWQTYAYAQRLMYDSWDKQACLVPIEDWPCRSLIRSVYRPWHDREILDEHPEAVDATLSEIDSRGPLSSLEFADRSRISERHPWYGPTRVKRILRALWAGGVLVTHHRLGARHYYDRAERVIPREIIEKPLLDEDEYHRWILLRRHRAAGLLRVFAEAAIWSGCGDAGHRRAALADLVEAGELLAVRIGDRKDVYHMPSSLEPILSLKLFASSPTVMRFVGPLDSILWDRSAVRQIFGFDYVWEVYKPEALRTWGYYVLPVFYEDRFVARVDSSFRFGTWTVARWWWEGDVSPDADMLDALRTAGRRFLRYLGGTQVRVEDAVPREVRQALAQTVVAPEVGDSST